MWLPRIVLVAVSATAVVTSSSFAGDLQLWYEKPAASWVEALPVGNGRMGAMVFGGAAEARFQFNEDTLWVGQPHDYAREGAREHLPTLRRLLFAELPLQESFTNPRTKRIPCTHAHRPVRSSHRQLLPGIARTL